MTISEARKAVKSILIAQKGNFYNYNHNNLVNFGFTSEQIRAAHNYFLYSPQQANFRAENNM